MPSTGLVSHQGEKSIIFYFIMVPLRKKYKSMVLQSPRLMPFRASFGSKGSGPGLAFFVGLRFRV